MCGRQWERLRSPADLLAQRALVEVHRSTRALRGVRFSGYDIVEVSPPYDGPGQTTALFAANVGYELLALTALAR